MFVRLNLRCRINSLLPEQYQWIDDTSCYGNTNRQPIIRDNEQGQCPFPQVCSKFKHQISHVVESVMVQLFVQYMQLHRRKKYVCLHRVMYNIFALRHLHSMYGACISRCVCVCVLRFYTSSFVSLTVSVSFICLSLCLTF